MYKVARQDLESMGIQDRGRRSKVGAAALCCCKVLIGLCLLPVGIAKLVVGAMYFHNCDMEPLIPIYLIVGGIAPLLFVGMTQGGRTEGEGQPSKACASFAAVCGIMGFVFGIGWAICGSIWVLPVYEKISSSNYVACDDVNPKPGCDEVTCDVVLATFAFAMVIIDWICNFFWALLILFMICVCCKRQV